MFFMFHILVFTIYVYEFGCIAKKINNREFTELFHRNIENSSFEDVKKNKTLFSTRNPLFRTFMKSKNLRSNVFDKMLSDEMFSMKQRFFGQELTQTSSLKKVSSQNAAQTPTLEVKQKWPAVHLLTKLEDNENPLQINDKEDENPLEIKDREDENPLQIKDKNDERDPAAQVEPDNQDEENISDEENILEVNSSSHDVPEKKNLDIRAVMPEGVDPIHPPSPSPTASRCSCAKSNNHGHQSAHGDGCTRNPNDFLYTYSILPYYFQYSPFFFNDDNLSMPPFYYPPFAPPYAPPFAPPVAPSTSKPKKTKTKRRKTTYSEENMYYDDVNADKNDKDIYDDKDSTETIKTDYDLIDKEKPSKDDLLDELDKVYNAEVEKKCYCSLSEKEYQTSCLYLYGIVVIYLMNL